MDMSVLRKLKQLVMKYWYRVCLRLFSVRKDVIIFESNAGRNYTGNPRAIYEMMVEQGLDRIYSCYFVFDEPEKMELPGKAIKIKRMRFLYYYAFAVAGTWVCDLRLPNELVKREACTYIQTWHGTPLKKLALDMEEYHMEDHKTLEEYKEEFRQNTSTWDYLLSPNRYSTRIFRRAFDFHGKIYECGYPRNDLLIWKNRESEIQNIREKLGLPTDKKVILYAPTWRDHEFYREGEYKFTTTMDFEKMKKELGDSYVMLVKYHYLVKDPVDWSEYEGFLYPCDQTMDISELYLAADIMITDYSSTMFDYSILRRPMYFYAYDLDFYRDHLRGFYYDFITEAPGPISQDTDRLIADIKKGTEQFQVELKESMTFEVAAGYREPYIRHFQKFNAKECGNAAEQVVKLIRHCARKHPEL